MLTSLLNEHAAGLRCAGLGGRPVASGLDTGMAERGVEPDVVHYFLRGMESGEVSWRVTVASMPRTLTKGSTSGRPSQT